MRAKISGRGNQGESQERQEGTQVLVGARDVRKSFHRTEVLHGVSLDVCSGQMLAIVGRSGSGKSTLLHCLAGLEDPDDGAVSLFGNRLATVSIAARAKMRRSDLGFVFQQYQLVPYLTAAQNVALPLRLARVKVRKNVIMQALAQVNMAGNANKRCSELSGGEQQRVALARVLVQQPRVIMADEPTGALDTATVGTVMRLLRVVAHRGCAIIVTHDPMVATQCDRILVLRDGILAQEIQPGDSAAISLALAEETTVENPIISTVPSSCLREAPPVSTQDINTREEPEVPKVQGMPAPGLRQAPPVSDRKFPGAGFSSHQLNTLNTEGSSAR